MKKIILIISLIAFSLFNQLDSTGIKISEKKDNIEDSIQIISNPNEPVFGEIIFDLEEDLRIGKESNENYLFNKIQDVQVDLSGNIYVSDMNNFRIQKFDKNGKYLQTIGRWGQGPGEFEQPTIIRIDNMSGNFFVKDYVYFIEQFKGNGDFIRSLKFPHPIHNFFRIMREIFLFSFANLMKLDMSINSARLTQMETL